MHEKVNKTVTVLPMSRDQRIKTEWKLLLFLAICGQNIVDTARNNKLQKQIF